MNTKYISSHDSHIATPPITTCFEAFLDKLLQLLPRSVHIVKLSPEKDLRADTNSSYGWLAEGAAPSFTLEGDSALYNSGYLYIEGILQRYSLNKARLYPDFGSGYSAESSLVIPVTRRGYIREIVYLPAGVVGLRWVPVDTNGYFAHQGLAIHRISRVEASLRSLYRVLFDLFRFTRINERRDDAINKLLKPLLRFKVQEAYRNTTEFRIIDSRPRSASDLWKTYEASFQCHLITIERACSELQDSPLISCVMIIPENMPPEQFAATIQSLQNQLYRQWELLILGHSAAPETGKHDTRIHYADKTVCQLKGRYVVFMDHTTRLEPHALFMIARTFQEHRVDLVYSDGLLADESTAHVEKFICRPAFSPELLRCHQYIRHLMGYDRLFLESLGNFSSVIAMPPYELLLRVSEKGASTAHIPQFLYRVPQKSNPQRDVEPERDHIAAETVQQHLGRSGQIGQIVVQTAHPDIRRISYTNAPDWRVAILIPTKDAEKLVRQCVESLEQTIHNVAYDIIIIDHASQEPASLQYFDDISMRHTILRYKGDFNFSRINNWAIKQIAGAPYTHYLFCNNDVEATSNGWLEIMLGFTHAADAGVVGAELLYPDRCHIQHAGVCIGLDGFAEHYGKFLPVTMKSQGALDDSARIALTCPHEVSAVTAACMLVRRDAFEAVGGFDEQMAVGFGDIDLCLRIGQAGYRCIYSPDSSLIHHESLTRGKDGGDLHPMDTVFFKKRWQHMLNSGDPFFNPAYSRYSFSWQYSAPLPCSINPAARVWKRKPC